MGSFRISFSRELTAASLWDFGEDHLMNRAMQMTVEDLNRVQELAAQYEDPSYPLPDPGQRVSHGHVIAYAAVTTSKVGFARWCEVGDVRKGIVRLNWRNLKSPDDGR
jgi:hypothetical protein